MLKGATLSAMAETKKRVYSMVKRVYRQHNSLVITLPKLLIESWGIEPGTLVEITYKMNSRTGKISVFREVNEYGPKTYESKRKAHKGR